MQRLIVRNSQAPGDIIVLSAALRDLAIAHPGKYAPEIWVSKGAEHIYWNSPFISKVHPGNRRPDVRGAVVYKAQYPLIKTCNQQRKHFILGFIEHMNATLGTKVRLTKFQPAIHMTDEEKATRPFKEPYWIFLSGGKKDYPTKIWSQSYWQQVIDRTVDRVNWVQCGGGSSNHIMHSPKKGIYANMVAKTDCRNFLRLIYHSEGVVCVTTMAMHAAAAFNKPCIVIEGGREPWWWEAYNDDTRRLNMRVFEPQWEPPADDDFVAHKYLHTIGKLPCCSNHGCWRKRVVGGGSVCKHAVPVGEQMVPKCKEMIKPDMVVAAIDEYLDDGLARRVDTKKILVPLTVMSVPDMEPPTPPPTPEPAPPTIKREPVPEGPTIDLGSVRFCLYGEDLPVQMSGPKVMSINHGTPRAEALRVLMQSTEDWLVWIEQGAKLHARWLENLLARSQDPALIGRIHRTPDGATYPYPVFFAVHRTLLSEQPEFTKMFVAAPEQFKSLGDIATLPTTKRTP